MGIPGETPDTDLGRYTAAKDHGVKYIWQAFHLGPSEMCVTLVWGSEDPEKHHGEDAGLTWSRPVLVLVKIQVLIQWIWAKPRNLHCSQTAGAAATQYQLFPLRGPDELFIFRVWPQDLLFI